MTDTHTLRQILTNHKRVAIVGLSDKSSRPSNTVAVYLLEHGFDVIPVNPNFDEILGRKCYPNLTAIPTPVEIVNLFRRVEYVPPVVDAAITIGAKVVWMQLGIVHEKAAQKARAAGLEVVMNHCMMTEYARLLGDIDTAGVDTDIIQTRQPGTLNR